MDRPISDADGTADAIRQPVVAPDRDVRPFQDVLLALGARLGLPGMVDKRGNPRYPGGYRDYLLNHERRPGIGMLAGWRGANGIAQGSGPPNPDQLARYIEHDCHWRSEIPAAARYYKNVNRAYLDYALKMGFVAVDEPIILNLYCEELQRFRLAARGHGRVLPPEKHRRRIETHFDPLPFWYRPFAGDAAAAETFPLHAVTQRPMAMYHSWGSQNAWLRQIHGSNRLFVPRALAAAHALGDDDWAWVVSRNGRVKVRIKTMEAVNQATIWTWNAIGKRAGAWNLAAGAAESTEGFLLNHLIHELLPPSESGYRYGNADPITGQAAWYDLRVRLEKAAPGDQRTEPAFPPLHVPPGLEAPPAILEFGKGFRARPAP